MVDIADEKVGSLMVSVFPKGTACGLGMLVLVVGTVRKIRDEWRILG